MELEQLDVKQLRDRAQQSVEAAVAPMQSALDQVDERVGKLEDELAELKSFRRELAHKLRLLTVNGEPTKPGPKPKGAKAKSRLVDDKLPAVIEWLREHADELNAGEGFFASELNARDDWTFSAGSNTSEILRRLHSREAIRLDHVGGRTGITKFYKVVAA
jgi:hypothetical protein